MQCTEQVYHQPKVFYCSVAKLTVHFSKFAYAVERNSLGFFYPKFNAFDTHSYGYLVVW